LTGTNVLAYLLYSFHGNHAVHHVELSLFPNWVGSDQERWVELVGDRLTLSASPLLVAGKQQVPRLVWGRIGSSPDVD
jgi:Lipocalin-like domain